jgi:hypothetical protein
MEYVSISPHRAEAWAIKHQGSILGYARNEDEAMTIGYELLDWLSSQGRTAELRREGIWDGS